jgi:hypothetical protein
LAGLSGFKEEMPIALDQPAMHSRRLERLEITHEQITHIGSYINSRAWRSISGNPKQCSTFRVPSTDSFLVRDYGHGAAEDRSQRLTERQYAPNRTKAVADPE